MRVERWEIRDDSGRIRATGGVTAVDTVIADRAAGCYIQMYESLAEDQQRHLLMGEDDKAEECGLYAPIARRAVDAEIRHPDSPDAPYKLCCSACTVWMATRGGR